MKNKRNLVQICLLCAVVLLLLPAVVQAQFGYVTNADNPTNITITNYTGPPGAVTVPTLIGVLCVTGIGDSAFAGTYGNFNRSLTSIVLPRSLTSIGDSAFAYCVSLARITIPPNVTNIGVGAFNFTASLTSITIPGRVVSVPDQAFANSGLQNVTISNGVTSIGADAFYWIPLTNITIPGSVTNIGDYAFWNCDALTSITIPNGVINLGTGVFENCFIMTNITLPASVANIGPDSFEACFSLTAITLDAQNAFYSSTNGVLFDKGQTILIQCPPAGIVGNYIIPDSVTSIGENAFNYCSGVTSVIIPDSVTNIGDNAFSTSGLSSVTIPNSVISMGGFAFYGCGNLTNVSIGNSVTSIGAYAFEACPLRSLTIPNSVTNLGNNAFALCESLTNVNIPNSVTSIGDNAFYNCSSLSGIYIQGDAPTLGSSVFQFDPVTVYYLPGTTGWNPQIQTSNGSFGVQTNGFGFNISGSSSLSIIVEACTNLANPIWSPVATNMGSSCFSDPQWTNYPARFYRLWGLTFAGVPAVLWNPLIQTADGGFGVRSNQFGFNITGTTNIPIVVEACTNLASPVWTPLTNVMLTNSFYFSDPQWTNYSARFYGLGYP